MLTDYSLPLLIALPVFGGILSWLVGLIHSKWPRYIAFISMLLTLILTILIWKQTQSSIQNEVISHWLMIFNRAWITLFNIRFELAIDGLSLLMIVLTAFLGLIAVLCSWHEIKRNTGAFYLNLLWSLAAVIGVFTAIDLFLFFFFWELMLIPIFFMISIWGIDKDNGISKRNAAIKFLIYTQVAGLILLIGIFALVWTHYNQTQLITFNYDELLNTHFTPIAGLIIMLCFFIGFAVKLPVLPLQGWIADAHQHAPTAGSVDIAGILIKTAPYGLLRFVLPIFPEASQLFAPIAIAIGFITLFYGAWVAFAQTEIKRLLGYATVSHMGLLVIGIYAFDLISLQGVVIMMIAQGVTSSALFILSGQIYKRYHTFNLTQLSGLWGEMRYLPAFMMFFCAALLGLPGTGDFIGEIFVLFGTFQNWPWITAIMAFAMVFAGLYTLILIHRALFGAPAMPIDKNSTQKSLDLNFREKLILVLLLIVVLWIGLAPQLILNTSESAMTWITSITQSYSIAGGL